MKLSLPAVPREITCHGRLALYFFLIIRCFFFEIDSPSTPSPGVSVTSLLWSDLPFCRPLGVLIPCDRRHTRPVAPSQSPAVSSGVIYGISSPPLTLHGRPLRTPDFEIPLDRTLRALRSLQFTSPGSLSIRSAQSKLFRTPFEDQVPLSFTFCVHRFF